MFGQLVLLSAVIAAATGLVAFVAWKYHRLSKARRYLISAPIMCGFLAILFAASRVFASGCFGDPSKTCTYNDMVPMIAVAVFIYVSMAFIKAWLLFSDR
jgi:hypothetical protein